MNINIKDLQLTESDFKMLIDGLDNLPNKGIGGEIMIDMLESLVDDKNPELGKLMKTKRDLAKKKKEMEQETLIEDIKILQGKLITFKRWLLQEGALTSANEIINNH